MRRKKGKEEESFQIEVKNFRYAEVFEFGKFLEWKKLGAVVSSGIGRERDFSQLRFKTTGTMNDDNEICSKHGWKSINFFSQASAQPNKT